MPYLNAQHSPAFRQAQQNALLHDIEQVHTRLIHQFGLPDDGATHLMVSEMLKGLVLEGKFIEPHA